MINLLPHEVKQTYRFARINHQLAHWITGFVAALLGIAIIVLGGLFYMNSSINRYSKQIDNSNSQLKAQDISGVQKQVKDMSNNLKLVVQVLSQEVLFSKLLARLGSVTPSNTILTSLSISKAAGGMDITAQTSSYDAATQLQLNLADPANQIFAKADIVSITCNASSANAKYPCSVTLRTLFAADNPFLFINNSAKASK
ncbi:MAG: PilN domain-containing protein [Candidatus Saccharimonadales bacterium]